MSKDSSVKYCENNKEIPLVEYRKRYCKMRKNALLLL